MSYYPPWDPYWIGKQIRIGGPRSDLTLAQQEAQDRINSHKYKYYEGEYYPLKPRLTKESISKEITNAMFKPNLTPITDESLFGRKLVCSKCSSENIEKKQISEGYLIECKTCGDKSTLQLLTE
jgi:hypothetical protein